MALKRDTKFDEKLAFCSKNDDVLLLSTAYKFSAKKWKRVISHDTRE